MSLVAPAVCPVCGQAFTDHRRVHGQRGPAKAARWLVRHLTLEHLVPVPSPMSRAQRHVDHIVNNLLPEPTS